VGDRSDELVTTLRKGADELRLVVSIAEHLSDSQDVLLDDLRIHEGIAPQCFENLFLGYEPIGMVDEISQEIERLRSERHALVAAPHTLIGDIETERMKPFHGWLHGEKSGTPVCYAPP